MHVHSVVPKRETCEALRDKAAAREHDEGEKLARAWIDGQRDEFERQVESAREDLAELEKNLGGPVKEQIARLRAAYERTRDGAQRERVRRALVESYLKESRTIASDAKSSLANTCSKTSARGHPISPQSRSRALRRAGTSDRSFMSPAETKVHALLASWDDGRPSLEVGRWPDFRSAREPSELDIN